MTIVFMFPGQSSRYHGMLDKLIEMHPRNRDLIAWASDLLDWDLAEHFRAENDQAFARNVDVQVGVFLANHMFLEMLEGTGVRADLSLGLSLGEWNHLVHIGALPFEVALRSVAVRGRLYDEGPRGWMAAIQPIAEDELRSVVDQATKAGLVEIVNVNSPRQYVISGERAAVQAAIELTEDEYFAQPEIIERKVPMHSSMFRAVGELFRAHLETLEFSTPRLPYLSNRIGELLPDPSKEQLVELLSTHLHEPVLWRQSLDHIAQTHPDAIFVEVGPKAVLHNLIHRKWLRNRKFRTDAREDVSDHFAGVVAELGGLRSC